MFPLMSAANLLGASHGSVSFRPSGIQFAHASHEHFRPYSDSLGQLKNQTLIPSIDDVRFGSKADMCSALVHVRFGPNADVASLRQGADANRSTKKSIKTHTFGKRSRPARYSADSGSLST